MDKITTPNKVCESNSVILARPTVEHAIHINTVVATKPVFIII